MPIYEFKCRKCGKEFEQLCRLNWEGKVSCPSCGAVDLEKLISAFCACGTDGGKNTAASCGGCSGGSCGHCH